MIDLAAAIEVYLLENPEWIPVARLCEIFQIDERELRRKGRKRPLCAFFAISSAAPGAHGLKHIKHATKAERLAFKHQTRRKLIACARADKELRTALANALSGKWPSHLVDGNGNRRLAL